MLSINFQYFDSNLDEKLKALLLRYGFTVSAPEGNFVALFELIKKKSVMY